MRYRKKPVEIEAVQFTGKNSEEIKKFVGDCGSIEMQGNVIIHTLEGDMMAIKGDYIIRGVNGEFYPCKPDIFKKTYDEMGE